MSGRYEKEMAFDKKTKNRLVNSPSILSEYYYSLIGAGKSYDTAYRYINYVLSFLDYTFKGEYNEDFYLHIKAVHINKYISSLRMKEVNGKIKRTSDSLRSGTWSALNSLFQFLVPDYLDNNPMDGTQRPKMKDNPKVTYLTKDEISKILENIEKNSQDRFKNRDLCLLKLGFSTGLRVSAMVNIDIDDIDLLNNQIKVVEKGDYDDYIMFGKNLKSQISLWLEDRQKYFADTKSKALFVSRIGKRLSDDMVAEILKKYSKGITDKKVTPHVMRHSCATNLYEETGDIYLCSKQLRHKQVSTTQRYAELSKENQKRAANILDNMI